MVVMVLERVPVSVRGELSRWMLELRAGVFVGTLSAMVRERLWQLTCEKMAGGAGLLVYSTNTAISPILNSELPRFSPSDGYSAGCLSEMASARPWTATRRRSVWERV